jgi:hypothetical protein
MISPVIKWDHSQNYHVASFNSYEFYEQRNVAINISDKDFEHIQGHVIDGKLVFYFENKFEDLNLRFIKV